MIQRPQPFDQVVEEDLDADVCLYRPDTDEVLVLNRSAADVWRLADGSLTVGEIVDRLARTYQVEPDALQSDVANVLTDLVERGYLVEGEPSSLVPTES